MNCNICGRALNEMAMRDGSYQGPVGSDPDADDCGGDCSACMDVIERWCERGPDVHNASDPYFPPLLDHEWEVMQRVIDRSAPLFERLANA